MVLNKIYYKKIDLVKKATLSTFSPLLRKICVANPKIYFTQLGQNPLNSL